MMVDGNPAVVRGMNTVGLKRKKVSPEARQSLKEACRILFRAGLSTKQAVERIRETVVCCREVEHLLAFIEKSERGIAKP
jgi:UDP-N-acetylglucosamine acyltransferase